MRKNLLITALFLVGFTTVNAQLFVGGGVSYTSNNKTEEQRGKEYTTETRSFILSPRLGYFLNDKVAIGISLSQIFSKTTEIEQGTATSNGNLTLIAPFARYYFAKVDKFSFFAEGQLGLGFGSNEVKYENNSPSKYKLSLSSFSVTPAVSYSFSNNFELETYINIFNISYEKQKSTLEDSNPEYSETNTDFKIGAGSNLGAITISAIYKF